MFIKENIKSKILELEPFLIKNYFEKFFSWEELEVLLNLRPYVSDNRLTILNCTDSYGWEQQAWMSQPNTYPPSMLDFDILKKYHCYLCDASRANKNLNSICKELEDIFPNSAADAHIFFNIADQKSQGLGIHRDKSHNLIVQIEGQSRIQIWAREVYYSDEILYSISQTPVIDEIINPGDTVFIPLKTYHNVVSQSKRLSISFPISFNNRNSPQDRHWIKL